MWFIWNWQAAYIVSTGMWIDSMRPIPPEITHTVYCMLIKSWFWPICSILKVTLKVRHMVLLRLRLGLGLGIYTAQRVVNWSQWVSKTVQTRCSNSTRWSVHPHYPSSHFCKHGNLRFKFNRQVTKPAGYTISQDQLYARPVEHPHDIRTDSKHPKSAKKV